MCLGFWSFAIVFLRYNASLGRIKWNQYLYLPAFRVLVFVLCLISFTFKVKFIAFYYGIWLAFNESNFTLINNFFLMKYFKWNHYLWVFFLHLYFRFFIYILAVLVIFYLLIIKNILIFFMRFVLVFKHYIANKRLKTPTSFC